VHVASVGAVVVGLASKYEFTVLSAAILGYSLLMHNLSSKSFLFVISYHVVGVASFYLINIAHFEQLYEDRLLYPLISIISLYLMLVLVLIIVKRKTHTLLFEEFSSGVDNDNTSILAKELLSLLLPKFVLDRMQNFFEISEEKHVIEVEDDITILFCDIADFDDVVRKNENKVVYLLDKIFRKFDDLCRVHGIQKIETVGKTYMCAAGLKAVELNLPQELTSLHHTLRTVNIAKDMMSHIKEYEGLNLKIGIHVGKPVMGVIGYHKPQFSLIGDVVNTTSRHCTTGKKGRIMLSQDAWELVKNLSPYSSHYSLEVVQTEMKGKGMVPVYHLYQSVKHFNTRLKAILAGKNKFKPGSSESKMIDIISRAVNKIVLNKKQSTQGLKILQLIQELRPTDALKSIYSKMSKRQDSNMPKSATLKKQQILETKENLVTGALTVQDARDEDGPDDEAEETVACR